jgi:hypothetical protein
LFHFETAEGGDAVFVSDFGLREVGGFEVLCDGEASLFLLVAVEGHRWGDIPSHAGKR